MLVSLDEGGGPDAPPPACVISGLGYFRRATVEPSSVILPPFTS